MKKVLAFALVLSLFCSVAFAGTKAVDPQAACEKLAAKKHVTAEKKDAFIAKCVKAKENAAAKRAAKKAANK